MRQWTTRQCGTNCAPAFYDPIPVNIVDLGLVYDCIISPRETGGASVNVKMTLTAPGCGRRPDHRGGGEVESPKRARRRRCPEVELVWDPPWNQAMISEVGKMKLGLI